jgi:NADPH-dependent 2,4-dienoyl-CoA reductase/sulfur reductase-like enzyme/ferredoxin
VASPSRVFPNYMQMPRRVSLSWWHVARFVSLAASALILVLLLVEPKTGLKIFWRFVIPLLPLLFFVAPGFWRNICPLAAMNQTPRYLGFTKALSTPKWFKEYGYVIAIAAFVIIVASRRPLFNHSGPATAALFAAALGGAFVAGTYFKGKSGWCSSMCPLLPVQRIYGQTPFLTLPNSHCQPCVGCTKNCYDFNPNVAYLADLHDDDRHYTAYRKFFVGAFPGLIYAYFQASSSTTAGLYVQFALYAMASAGIFFLLDSFVKVSANRLTSLFGAVALNLFYWYGIKVVLGSDAPDAVVWGFRALLLAATVVWVVRTWRKEGLFVREALERKPVGVGQAAGAALEKVHEAEGAQVTFQPGDLRVAIAPGTTLLEVAEANDLPIEAGCRMGMCGADPIGIVDGMAALTPMGDDERKTIERLGLSPDNTRMACCARVNGTVCATLEPERPKRPRTSGIGGITLDESIKRVVIVGNGIAGVTCADHVRRRHPGVEIDLIADEVHQVYNRMAITRLIYGRSAMRGLYLLPDSWWDANAVTPWLNTRAQAIDVDAREVLLGTGERLTYDRLVLTMGSSGYVPPIEGYGAPGSFVLRCADDAFAIRSFVQDQQARRAVVAGGGLLGLEAAYALHKLGVEVSVLERSPSLLRRQLDARAGELLRDYLEGLGIEVLVQAETETVRANGRVRGVCLRDGRQLDADLFLVAAGITPNTKLAHEAGLEVNRGVIVDDELRTSAENVWAAGDVAEHRGQILGLWPTAVEQAEVAAQNLLGADRTYEGTLPVTMLKVVGVNLSSIGRIEQLDGDEAIALEDPDGHNYRKLLIDPDGHIAGAILLGYPNDAPAVQQAVKDGRDVRPQRDALRAGDWSVLSAEPAAV